MGDEARHARLTRVMLSLGATVAGWAAAYLYFLLVQLLIWHSVTDVAAMLFWPALFIAIGWLFVVLPVALFVSPDAALFASWRSWLFGAIAGLAVFLALLAWWTPLWQSPWYLGFPIIVGAVACSLYSKGLVHLGLRARRPA